MSTRQHNEKKFRAWENVAGGGRLCRLDAMGRQGWRACYLKLVDPSEKTLRFWQEIFDEAGTLVEVHEKFPVDKGHQKL